MEECRWTEERHGDRRTFIVNSEKDECQRIYLIGGIPSEAVAVMQNPQRCEKERASKCLDHRCGKTNHSRDESSASADGLEEIIEQDHRDDLRSHFYQVDRKSCAIERFVRENVRCSLPGIGEIDQAVRNESLSKQSADYGNQIEDARKPSHRARRDFIHHL